MNITPAQMEAAFADRICLGNEAAKDFLLLWSQYVHAIDDIEDEETTSEFRLKTFALAIEVYSHPFYLTNLSRLKQVALNCTNAYADVVKWEKSEVPWQKEFADHYRHFGCEMPMAVASIVGGYAAMRAVSLEFRTACYVDHHKGNGEQK